MITVWTCYLFMWWTKIKCTSH